MKKYGSTIAASSCFFIFAAGKIFEEKVYKADIKYTVQVSDKTKAD